jgi:hypothetical protein
MHLKIGKIFFRSAVRLASLSNSHPLHRQYWLAVRKVRRHQSALHYMTQIYGIKSDEVEMLPVVRQNPAEQHRLPMNVEIPKDKETSIQLERHSTEVIKVFTDGSAHNGRVGMAAILIRQGQADQVLRLCLGTTKQHSVPEAEMVGLILGLHLIAKEK